KMGKGLRRPPMPATPLHPPVPRLIASPAALAGFLRATRRGEAAWTGSHSAIGLEDWRALGEDASEASWKAAQRLGLRLLRLEGLAPQPQVVGLLPPETARGLRAIPIAEAQGMVAVAMEDPGDAERLASLDFILS